MNHVTIAGNAVREPELRFSQGGLSIASFGIAYSTRKKGDNGQWEDGETSFFDVTCFGQLADNVAESIHKGDRVIVTGTLKQRSWEAKDSGEKRSKVEIIADEVGPSLKWATTVVERANGSAVSSRTADSSQDPF
jgi:single-strand DNA-binding protein